MTESIDHGNIVMTNNVGYIVGDRFEELTQLQGVFTVTQFFKALLEDNLPTYRSWVIGQGVDASTRHILHLCEHYRSGGRFQPIFVDSGEVSTVFPIDWEWHQLRFTEATRLEAELILVDSSANSLFTQDFIFNAARELVKRGCALALPGSLLVTKQAQFQNFLRIFPLPIHAEAQFHLVNDNKRSLKSTVRFYQDYHCVSELNLQFDLYEKPEASEIIQEFGKKTFESFTRHASDLEPCFNT